MKHEAVIEPNKSTIQDGLPKPRIYWAWATLMVGLTLAVIDGTIANVALPTIAADFSAGPAASIWIVNGYQLAIVITLLPFAALGEIYSYRRVYLLGVSLFTLASIACVFARSLEALTIARIIQGFGAAGLMSVNAALLRYTVPQAKLGTAIGERTFRGPLLDHRSNARRYHPAFAHMALALCHQYSTRRSGGGYGNEKPAL